MISKHRVIFVVSRIFDNAFGAILATPLLFVRIDDVDFSFHAIPNARDFVDSSHEQLIWNAVRLKPIAPIVLAWARSLLKV